MAADGLILGDMLRLRGRISNGQLERVAALQDRPHGRAFWSATATTARP